MLTSKEVINIKKTGRYAHINGLYLQVSKSGTKSWIYRYQLRGKRHEIGLGSIKNKILSEAAKAAEEYNEKKKQGIDPKTHKITLQRTADTTAEWTFKRCVDKYIETHSPAWKNSKHISQWENTLETYAVPVFGHLPVDQVNTALVLEVLEPIWHTKTETASRLRGRIENVLSWSIVRGYREGPNPAIWRGHLSMLLPQRSKIQKVRHFSALPYSVINEFMNLIKQHESISAKALKLLILTASRTNEIIGAKWEEFDMDTKVWTIKAKRMKAERDHREPLSIQAIQLLSNLDQINEWVFPGQGNNKHISNMTMLKFTQIDLNRPEITVHGFRSTFRDWAAEVSNFPRELAESTLAHTLGNKTEAAYQRGDLLEKRRKMMQAWADYCDIQEAADVLSIKAVK